MGDQGGTNRHEGQLQRPAQPVAPQNTCCDGFSEQGKEHGSRLIADRPASVSQIHHLQATIARNCDELNSIQFQMTGGGGIGSVPLYTFTLQGIDLLGGFAIEASLCRKTLRNGGTTGATQLLPL